MADDRLIALLDAELPQTQCGLCGHAEGCLPYATAMVQQQEPANRCVPGEIGRASCRERVSSPV